MAQMDYRQRHKVARIHWDISRKHIGNEAKVLWPQTGKKVIESNNGQLLWDYSTQTDREMKDQTYWQVEMYVYDIAVPGDARVAEKEKEKIETYQDLS